MGEESAKGLSREDFKRRYGVHPETFDSMVKVAKVERMLQKRTGRNDKLSIESQVLMTLSYWREYRTYFHIAQDWKVNESTAYRIIRRVEDMLIKSGMFALPGKKTLTHSDCEIEAIAIDVTEHQVERPQKNKNLTTVVSKRGIH